MGTSSRVQQGEAALADAQSREAVVRSRLSSGQKIQSARDNGATWSIARRMAVEARSFEVANDSLDRGATMLDVAASGVEQIQDLLTTAREKALALKDPSIDSAARQSLAADIKALISQVDRVSLQANFDGRRPLADKMTTGTVTYTQSSYAVATSALTPASLGAAFANTAGTASQTFIRDGGAAAGRIDLYLDAYSVADTLEIWQSGVRKAATGQAYSPGGAGVGVGSAVSGKSILSFDYDPTDGRNLEFRFNEAGSLSGTAWSVDGVALQALPSAAPALTTTSYAVPGVTTSTATSYAFVADAQGGTEAVTSHPLTAEALKLDTIDWTNTGSVMEVVDQALATTRTAGLYFGGRQEAFAGLIAQNRKLTDTLSTGVGNLVDADMATESARLQALEARTTLATQAFAIANGQQHWVLELFR